MRNHHLHVLLFACITLLSSGCARKNFFTSTPIVGSEQYQQLQTASPAEVDSVTIQAGRHYKRSGFHNIFWGQHYRSVWAAPVRVEVFDMQRTKGGLSIEKLGGGMQTTSLTLADKNGFKYALRSLDKDPLGILPPLWRKSFVSNVLRDQTSAINPYAALVLPPMAEAAGIPHSTPRLVYVLPSDESFGDYRDRFQDGVFMIEEKYNDERTIPSQLEEDASSIASSKKMLKKRFGDDNHFIDERAFAKARLFDILVNDWDRHEGQWEWGVSEKEGDKMYHPIPKDRDNAFFQFGDGIIPWLFSRRWAIRKFESFDKKYKDVYALMINSKFIDDRAMTELNAQDFQILANELKDAITDEVIENAISLYPDTVYNLVGESTIEKLKNRRDQLPEAAQEFYLRLAKNPLVIGTDKEDRFVVQRLNDEETSVTVYRLGDKKQVYHRVFKRSETKQVTLHGLAEDDEFEISGQVDRGIKVEIVGGRGEDKIKDTSRVRKGWGRHTIVRDTKRGTEIEAGPETKEKTTHKVKVHAFDREGY